MNRLQKAIATVLAGSVLAGFTQQAAAMPVTDLGTLANADITSTLSLAKYSWDGTAGLGAPPHNEGWTHTSNWVMFRLEQRSRVTIKLRAKGPDLNPAATVWKTKGEFDGNNHQSHVFNQIGNSGASEFLVNGIGNDKVRSFVGYVNSGNAFTGGGGEIEKGGPHGAHVRKGFAKLVLFNLRPGQYLMAIGGSCFTDGTARVCGEGRVDASLTITRTAP